MSRCIALVVALSLAVSRWALPTAEACPFCSAQQMTLSEEMKTNDLTVICKLVHRPENVPADAPPAQSECTFEVTKIVKGEKFADQLGPAPHKIKILYFGEKPLGSTFLAFGITQGGLAWGTPVVVDERSIAYVSELPKLAESGADRLQFFQKYFEDQDPLLAADAYDEFAKAPYSDLVALKDRMPREKLLGWINDKNVTTSRRRLYLCMLSVCGQPADVPMLEALVKNEDRQIRTALDAMIGSYLALKGVDGVPLVEDLFLKNNAAEYTDTYSAIMALRFIGQETKSIPRERLIEAMRHMLGRPKLADLIIPDLTRWEDWSVMQQLVNLFKNADEESSWVRVPVVNYLRACPLPEAQKHLEELAKIDPDAVRRAALFFPNAGATPPPSAVRSGEIK
jgi:hypothetical protein